jgi:hypothetical protein
MIQIPLQVMAGHKTLAVLSHEDQQALKAYGVNQIVNAKITGCKRPRSVQQNRYIHAIFRIVADNTDDPDWDTPEKVKRNVKMAIHFYKNEDIIVQGNKVYFMLRSFNFQELDQAEADIVYNAAKLACAKKLKVDPETLEAMAKEEAF